MFKLCKQENLHLRLWFLSSSVGVIFDLHDPSSPFLPLLEGLDSRRHKHVTFEHRDTLTGQVALGSPLANLRLTHISPSASALKTCVKEAPLVYTCCAFKRLSRHTATHGVNELFLERYYLYHGYKAHFSSTCRVLAHRESRELAYYRTLHDYMVDKGDFTA